jgi:hypothetical protein
LAAALASSIRRGEPPGPSSLPPRSTLDIKFVMNIILGIKPHFSLINKKAALKLSARLFYSNVYIRLVLFNQENYLLIPLTQV